MHRVFIKRIAWTLLLIVVDLRKQYCDFSQTESLSFEARNPVLPSTQRERDQLITPIKSPRSANQSPRTNTGYDPLSTWGSTFDSTTQACI